MKAREMVTAGRVAVLAAAVALGVGFCNSVIGDERPIPDARTQKFLDENGITYAEWLLFDGIYKKDAAQVDTALRQGANVNTARDYRGYPSLSAQSPLLGALYSGGDPTIVALLVSAGADVNKRYKGTSSTNYEQLTPAAKMFLAAKEATADPRSKEFFPLYWAVDTKVETVRILLAAGADPKQVGGSASQAIFKTHDIEVASLLIKYGADINAKNFEGETVLTHAKRELKALGKSHHLLAKMQTYCAWLPTVGAHE